MWHNLKGDRPMEEIKEERDEELKDITNGNRRSFIKKVAIGTVFAVPAIPELQQERHPVKSALAAGSDNRPMRD